jgi:hypothetical protein
MLTAIGSGPRHCPRSPRSPSPTRRPESCGTASLRV